MLVKDGIVFKLFDCLYILFPSLNWLFTFCTILLPAVWLIKSTSWGSWFLFISENRRVLLFAIPKDCDYSFNKILRSCSKLFCVYNYYSLVLIFLLILWKLASLPCLNILFTKIYVCMPRFTFLKLYMFICRMKDRHLSCRKVFFKISEVNLSLS